MKKIFALILTLALIFSLAAVPAYAATINSLTGNAGTIVKATYNSGTSDKKVYSVDITWGNMNFSYTSGAWDPDTHTYKGTWDQNENDDHTVTVTNHSNAPITANLTYTPGTLEDDFKDNVTGTFDKPQINLISAVGTTLENAPTDTAHLTLTGTLTESSDYIGRITVTIAEYTGE